MNFQGDLEFFMPILQAQYWNRISHASSTVIVIYDYFITFGDEYEFIWKSRWSLGKVLFLLSRYYTLLSTILEICVLYSPFVTTRMLVQVAIQFHVNLTFVSPDCCTHLETTDASYWSTVLQAFGALFQVVITDLILQVRLHAMYEGSKTILYGAGMPFALISLTAAAQLVLYAIGAIVTAENVPGDSARFCLQKRAQFGDTWVFWAELLALEILLFGFALFKAYQTYRQMDDVTGSFVPKTLHVLIRDSTLYFLLIAVSYMANTIVSPIKNGLYQHLPEGFAASISSVMSQRLILNLRLCYYGKSAHGDLENFTLSSWLATSRPLHSVDFESNSQRRSELSVALPEA